MESGVLGWRFRVGVWVRGQADAAKDAVGPAEALRVDAVSEVAWDAAVLWWSE
jgi:hypothetical protein